MIWLAWRQFRLQTLIALGLLAILGAYLIFLGLGIHDFYDTRISGCNANNTCDTAASLFREKYSTPVGLIGALLIVVPAVIGVFWGAPLITRELETGTYKLVWNQTVTRTRWLTIKLLVIALLTVAFIAVLTFLLSWAVDPFDKVIGSRFAAMTFDARDIVPLGYALFAFTLGTTVGILIRRTLPAMAVTLAVFAALQIVMPLAIRPHLRTPITANVAFTAEVARNINGLGSHSPPSAGDSAVFGVSGYTRPGAWMLGSDLMPLKKADGTSFTQKDMKACMTGDFPGDTACLAKKNLHFSQTYHPASRYWPFQWMEMSIFLALALAMTAVCFWRVQRVS